MDLFSIISSILVLTFLGLLIAFSPMLIIVDLLIVIKSRRPVLNVIILLLGTCLPLIALALIAVAVMNPNQSISLGSVVDKLDVPPLIDMAFGVVLISLAVRQIAKRRLDSGSIQSKPARLKSPPDKPWALFSFAVIKSIFSVTNIFAILVVAKIIVINQLDAGFVALVLLWTIGIGLIPFFIILYYHKFKHSYLLKLDKKLDSLMARNMQSILIVILLAAGTTFCLSGFISII